MTADVRRVAATTRAPGVPARLFGFGSIFGKSVRDGRRGGLVVAGLLSLVVLSTAAALAAEWPTPEERRALVGSMEILPLVIRGLLGDPIAIDTLGGFVSWRIGNIAPVMVGIWSVLALSGALAVEARRGSLDVLASSPVSRRRIALEKALAHLALVAAAMLVVALSTSLAGAAVGTVPEDGIPLVNALGHFTLTGLLILAAGSVSFAAAPVLGRGRAAGLGALALFGGYLVLAYRSVSPALEALNPLSWYAWTADHRPLAGQWDWPPVILLAIVTAGFLALGVVAFERRDIGVEAGAGRVRLPGLPAGTRGPFTRQLADRAGVAIAAGLGIGAYGGLIAASADAFIESLSQMPGVDELFERVYPGVDITEPSGILQLAFFAFGSVLVAFAAAAIGGGWASDETGNRLDFVLAAPLARVGWFLASAAAVFAALVVVAVVAGVLIGAGVAASGGDLVQPAVGGLVLALIGAAFAAIGLAVGGLGRPDLAGLVAGAAALASYLLSVLGNALQLPGWLVDLSLYEHLGQPMSGVFDPAGLAVMVALVVGGVAVGAAGFTRRDLHR